MILNNEPPPRMKTKAERMAERATLESWTQEALALAQRCGEFVMHELRPVNGKMIPLYIIPVSWFPSTQNLSVGGQCCQFYDAYYRPIIEQRSAWRGRGPCVTVNNFAAFKAFPDVANPAVHRELFKRLFVGLALHECAHAISDAPFRVAEEVSPEVIGIIESRQVDKNVPITTQPNAEPWLQHEPLIYGRVLIHLADRINRSGLIDFKIPIRALFGHGLYRTSPLKDYAAAFGDETTRLAAVPLSHLFIHDVPEAAAQLWKRDHETWHMCRANNSAGKTK